MDDAEISKYFVPEGLRKLREKYIIPLMVEAEAKRAGTVAVDHDDGDDDDFGVEDHFGDEDDFGDDDE